MLRKLWRRLGEAAPGKRLVAAKEIIKRQLGGKLTDHVILYRLDDADYARGPAVPWTEGLTVHRFEDFQSIPQEFVAHMPTDERARLMAGLAAEIDNGGILWVGTIGGDLAGSKFSIRGSFLPDWYVPLKRSDIVIYAGGTLTAFRGRGIHPAMMRYIMENEPRNGGEIYCDALVWNTIAQRNIEKAGYRPIGKSRQRPHLNHGA